MGAESSTAQSVDHLGRTLSEIERKLGMLEENDLLQRSTAISRYNIMKNVSMKMVLQYYILIFALNFISIDNRYIIIFNHNYSYY